MEWWSGGGLGNHDSTTPSLHHSITSLLLFPFVEYFPQHQPVRGRRHPGRAPVLLRQHLSDFLRAELPLPDLHERAHDATAHFVEETVPFKDERPQRAVSLDVATSQGPHR